LGDNDIEVIFKPTLFGSRRELTKRANLKYKSHCSKKWSV